MMSAYTESVGHHCGGVNVAPGTSATCDICLDGHGIERRDARGRFRSVDAMQESLYEVEGGGFSWTDCETCGSTFGGDRHAAHGQIDGKWHHLEVCTDCLLFFANGDEPEEPWYQHPREWRAAQSCP